MGEPLATVLDASWYTSDLAYGRERTAVFGREWLFICDEGRIERPGDHLGVTVAGFPLVLVNDGGTLRGYHNVCRHRGGPLVWEGASTGPTLVCRYHGWAYGLDGRLRSARDFGAPPDCTAGLALSDVQVESWRGLVFANLWPEAPRLLDALGTMVDECVDFPMDSFVPAHRSSHDLRANWKVYAENYQEGYHIPLVHPNLHRQIESRRYEVEVRATDGYCVHRAPARDGSVTAGVWLWRFPGFALNLYPGGMCVESFAPTGPLTTRVDYVFLFAPDTPATEADAAVASSTAILEEDRTICEAVQRNLESGLWSGGILSPRHEQGVQFVQRRVLDAVVSTPVDAGGG